MAARVHDGAPLPVAGPAMAQRPSRPHLAWQGLWVWQMPTHHNAGVRTALDVGCVRGHVSSLLPIWHVQATAACCVTGQAYSDQQPRGNPEGDLRRQGVPEPSGKGEDATRAERKGTRSGITLRDTKGRAGLEEAGQGFI